MKGYTQIGGQSTQGSDKGNFMYMICVNEIVIDVELRICLSNM